MSYVKLLFSLPLGVPDYLYTPLLDVVVFFAEYTIWLISALIVIRCLRGGQTRKMILETIASALAGIFIHQIVGQIWQHLRPFMINWRPVLAAPFDASFSGDYLMLLLAIAFGFLVQRHPRQTGIALALLGLSAAWVQIHLGVHFPFDLGGAVLAIALSTWLIFRKAHVPLTPVRNAAARLHDTFIFRPSRAAMNV